MIALAERMNRLRLRKGESLQDVATAVGVSKAHIWELEKGRADNPSMGLVTRLAEHFGVSVAYLIGEDAGRRRCRRRAGADVPPGAGARRRRPRAARPAAPGIPEPAPRQQMSLALSRIEIESAGSDPRKLARGATRAAAASHRSGADRGDRPRARHRLHRSGSALRHRGLPAVRSAEERGTDRGERQQPAAAAALHHRP